MTNSKIGLVDLVFQTMVILTLFNTTTAYWCTAKKKELTQLDQIQAISDAQIKCIVQKDTSLKNNNGTTCPKIFDGLICWPRTEAGTTTTSHCPSYVHGFNTAGNATKECLQNGEWFIHPSYNTTFTNFTGCVLEHTLPTNNNSPSIEELMKDHIRSIQTLYRVGYGISLTFLVAAVIIMTCLRKLRCQRNIIHVNLFLSYIFRCIICFIKDENGVPEEESNIVDEVIRQITSSKSIICYTVIIHHISVFNGYGNIFHNCNLSSHNFIIVLLSATVPYFLLKTFDCDHRDVTTGVSGSGNTCRQLRKHNLLLNRTFPNNIYLNETKELSSWCKFVHVLFFYFVVTNYMWIFIEGIYLHILIFVTTFHNLSKKIFRCLVILGWVSPVLFVIPWAIVRKMYEDTLCWNLHNRENGYIWIVQGPIVATLSINFVFFLNIIRVLFTKLSSANSRDPKRYRKLARSTLVLIPLFGVHYIVFMAIPICLNPEAEIVWMYTELFFSSFQGFILSMLFCFLNTEVHGAFDCAVTITWSRLSIFEIVTRNNNAQTLKKNPVRNEITKHWKWHRLRRQSLVSSRSTRTFSIQSSGSVRDQGSPTINDKHMNGFIRESNSSNSLVRQNMMKNNSESDIYQNDINNVNISLKITDDNENEQMPFFSGEKVSFL